MSRKVRKICCAACKAEVPGDAGIGLNGKWYCSAPCFDIGLGSSAIRKFRTVLTIDVNVMARSLLDTIETLMNKGHIADFPARRQFLAEQRARLGIKSERPS